MRLCRTVATVLFLIPGIAAEAAAPGKPKGPHFRVDVKTKTIEVHGTFCLGEYPLELLVCQNDMRDYESLVSTPCRPFHLHLALIGLGLKPRVRDKKDMGKILREGDPIEILLRFKKDGKVVTAEPRQMILDVASKRHIRATPWVFAGSHFFPSPDDETKLEYLGDAEQWLIGVLGDSPSVIDLPPRAASKYGDIVIDTKVAPPKGTKVTVIIRPAPRPKQRPPAEADPPAPNDAAASPRK